MSSKTYLLLDGYNIIHALPEFKRLLKDGWVSATARLTEWVRVIYDVEHIRVSLVFDGNGDSIECDPNLSDGEFLVIFSPKSLSADSVIEHLVFKAPKKTQIQVVSQDNLLIQAVQSMGALVYCPAELKERIKRCEARQSSMLYQNKKTGHSRFSQGLDFGY